MKHVFRFFLLLGFSLLSSLGCSTSFDQDSDGGYRVRIPVNDSQGQYHLQTVTLKSVTNISSLSGSVLNIRVNGKLMEKDKADGTKQVWVQDFGTVPAAHFVKSDDVYIPSDYRTSVMASLVYQFEQIKDFYEVYNGNEGLQFPRTVLFDIKKSVTGVNGVGEAVDNAEYTRGLDMFEVQPYDKKLLPLAVNGGIWAHEYSHSVFEARRAEKSKGKVAGEIKKESLALICANTYQYKGLDEGIADFFGYAYSHDPNFGATSLDFEGNLGRSVKEVKNVFMDGGDCTSNEHELGAGIAHLLYVISEDWGIDETSKATLNFENFYVDLYTTDYDKSFIGLAKDSPPLI